MAAEKGEPRQGLGELELVPPKWTGNELRSEREDEQNRKMGYRSRSGYIPGARVTDRQLHSVAANVVRGRAMGRVSR